MRKVALVALVALAGAGCSEAASPFPVVASSPGAIGTGEQRVLVAVIDQETQAYLADPAITPVATLRNEDGSPLSEATGEFVWTVPESRGVYAFEFDIPEPATYQMTIDAGELGSLGPLGFVAFDDPPVVRPGEQAPRSETRTIEDHSLDEITSDPSPEPGFYEMSVSEAVASGPSAIVFATPAWCTSQSCGPLLDQLNEMAADYPGVNFVHVEIYEDISVSSFEDLRVVPAVEEWGLPSEPWVFFTGAAGVVAHAYEGAASDDELREALEVIAG